MDRAHPACSDAGPGTEAAPFCKIGAALPRGGPGVTIFVKPGVYRERLVPLVSGAVDSPFVFQALASGPVVIDGADDFSSDLLWTASGGDVWLASSVTLSPKQVFIDDIRLTPSPSAPAQLPPSSFTYVPGSGLYVNAGGGNPGLRRTFVGVRGNAFRVTGRSWIEIRDFQVTRCEDKGIYVLGGSHHVLVHGDAVSACVSNGIGVNGSTDVTIEGNRCWDNGDHGISMIAGVTRSLVRDNESFRNARPAVRAATGLYLFGSPGNRLEGNRLHHNQDSGMELNGGSNDNVSIQNLSWSNGDHGFDHLYSTGNHHVGDVAWGNYKDGFSIEGSATGASIHNCIAVNNGVTSGEFNLYVDAGSNVGLISDYNIFWNATPVTSIRVGGISYASLAAHQSGTGLDLHSDEADPLFADAVNGHFEVGSGSPAIDSGVSSVPFWPEVDARGRGRVDIVVVPDRGAGTVPYTDRGALEYVPTAPPALEAPASVSVAEGALLSITVRASDPSGQPILELGADLSGLPTPNDAAFVASADFRTGTLTWHPAAGDSGSYNVTFLARSSSTATAATRIRVFQVDRPPVVAAPGTVQARPGSPVSIDVTASDPDGDPIATLVADLSNLPAGANATFTVNPTRTAGTFRWTPAANVARKNYRVGFTASNALSTRRETVIKVRNPGLTNEPSSLAVPARYELAGPFPNPGHGEISMRLAVPEPGVIEWSIVDLQGRTIWTDRRAFEAGIHAWTWNARSTRWGDAPPGVYFARIRSPFEDAPRELRFLLLR